MHQAMTAPVLEPVGEGKVALDSVNVDVAIENLLCEVTLRQVYRNLEKINIEAVYTFPLPFSAVLLDMTIKTKTRVLKGVVVEKSEAEERYEGAITDGDTAIMLQQIEDGLYTMNVGNLQPEDEVKVSITYAELFKWQNDSLRFFLPTNIAPRYGDPESVGLEPYQIPEYEMLADNRFNLTVTVLGELANASFNSPSHLLDFYYRNGKTILSLQGGHEAMDRDFVLNISMKTEQKSLAILDRDFDDYVALASFYPRFPDIKTRTPRCVTIIVDCSGSMQGDSIAQARAALGEILGLLRPQDHFNIIRFGSTFEKLFSAPVQAKPGNLKKAESLLQNLQADMGGTEIGQAIKSAIGSKTLAEISHEVLLITDGEVWDWEPVTTEAEQSGYRFFTVGVGSAVSEAFVKTLAEITGGACELVSPRENMAEKIVRHFKRIYFPKAGNIEIKWPGTPYKVFPKTIGSIYDGDTLHVFGHFKEKPVGDVTLTALLENGETFTQTLPMSMATLSGTEADTPGTTARIAAAREIICMAEDRLAADLAVKYQLMTQYTNYLAIDIKEEGKKAEDLPALRKTAQMLAAGWGGTGVLEVCSVKCDSAAICDYETSNDFVSHADRTLYDMEELITPDGIPRSKAFLEASEDNLSHVLEMLNQNSNQNGFSVSTINDLRSLGVQNKILEEFEEIHDFGIEENIIVVVFLYLLSLHENYNKVPSRQLKRIITIAYKQLPHIDEKLIQNIKKILNDNTYIMF